MNPLPHLRALETAGLIRLAATQPELEYTFRHTLMQEAVYHTLSKFARVSAHRAVAEALEAVYATGEPVVNHLGDLAYHFAQAGQWDKALDYAARAGAHAQAMYAPREALIYLDQAMEAARRLGTPAPWAVLSARGQVYETLGRLDQARADYEQALAQARAAGDQRAEWQSLLALGFLWAARDYAQAGGCFRAALALARAMGDPASLGHSLNRLGNWHVNIEEHATAQGYHAEALAIFEALGDRHSVAQTLDLLGISSALTGDFVSAERYYPRAIALFRELDDRAGLISSRTIYLLRTLTYETALQASEDMSLAAFQEEGEAILALARGIGLRSAETFVLGTLALGFGPRGAYGLALEYGHDALRIAEEIQHHQWTAAAHYALGALHLDVLALPQAQHHLEAGLALAQQIGSLIWMNILRGTLGRLHVDQHSAAVGPPAPPAQPPQAGPPPLARAQTLFDQAHSQTAPLRTNSEAIVWQGRAHLALARGDPARALEIAEQLWVFAAGAATPTRPLPVIAWLRAQALADLGRHAEALPSLEAARAGAQAQGALSLLWRIHLTLARVRLAQGEPALARAARDQARGLLHALAQNLPAGALRENFVQQTERLVSASA